MATHASAEKRNRQSQKRRLRNQSVKSAMKTVLKQAHAALASGDKAKADQAVREATRTLDRAATKGVLHARNAARRISRLAQAYTKAVAAKAK